MFNHPSLYGCTAIKEIALPGCGEWQSFTFVSPKIDEGVGSASESHSLTSGESPFLIWMFCYLLYLKGQRIFHNCTSPPLTLSDAKRDLSGQQLFVRDEWKKMHLECSFNSLSEKQGSLEAGLVWNLGQLAKCIGMRVISVQFYEDFWVCGVHDHPRPSSISSSQADQVDLTGRSQCTLRWLRDMGTDTKLTLRCFSSLSLKTLKHLYLAFVVSTSEHLFMGLFQGHVYGFLVHPVVNIHVWPLWVPDIIFSSLSSVS